MWVRPVFYFFLLYIEAFRRTYAVVGGQIIKCVSVREYSLCIHVNMFNFATKVGCNRLNKML